MTEQQNPENDFKQTKKKKKRRNVVSNAQSFST